MGTFPSWPLPCKASCLLKLAAFSMRPSAQQLTERASESQQVAPSPRCTRPCPMHACMQVPPPSVEPAVAAVYRQLWNVRVLLLRPVLLGAIHRATGNAMPSAVPARGAWLQHDIARTAAMARLPSISPPPGFGSPRFSTLPCQRLLTALALHQC
ncbi:unnamed protein product [Closterium sp. Yama58-4]|nr:unnamed protein product [Closterium sp. Yama58-4]